MLPLSIIADHILNSWHPAAWSDVLQCCLGPCLCLLPAPQTQACRLPTHSLPASRLASIEPAASRLASRWASRGPPPSPLATCYYCFVYLLFGQGCVIGQCHHKINIFGETLTSVDWDNVWTVFVGLTPYNCSNDPWTTQIRSRTLFWSTNHSFQLQLSHSSLGNQTSGTTGHALTTMLDYRKCYVELSQGRRWGAVKLRILLTCAETVCKYFSNLRDSSQGQSMAKSHWMLINRAAWCLWSNFGCILETRLLGEISFPCVLVIPEAASFACWSFTDNS